MDTINLAYESTHKDVADSMFQGHMNSSRRFFQPCHPRLALNHAPVQVQAQLSQNVEKLVAFPPTIRLHAAQKHAVSVAGKSVRNCQVGSRIVARARWRGMA